jgi:hypothetical protein
MLCWFLVASSVLPAAAQDTDAELDRLLKAVTEEGTSDEDLEKLLGTSDISAATILALELEKLKQRPKWTPVLTLEVGAGIKDNVSLSPVRPETSPLFRSLFDLIVIRDSTADGLEAFFYGSWEDFRYSDSEVDKEQTGLLMAEFKKEFESGWDLSCSGQYIYQNQILDLSTDFALPQTLRIEGNTFLTSATARRYLPKKTWVEASMELGRQNFISPLDDYWEYTPRAEVAKWWGRNHVALSYQLNDRPYDNRTEADGTGANILGTQLEFNVHRIELEWLQNWGTNGTWRTTTKIRRELSFDNGAGFFKYRRWRIGEKIRYRKGKWTINGEFNWSAYQYPNQVAVFGFADRRKRSDWNLGLRINRQLNKYWAGYLAYDYEKADSNQASSSYDVNLVHAGLVFER